MSELERIFDLQDDADLLRSKVAALQQEVARLREELQEERDLPKVETVKNSQWRARAKSAESSLLAVREALEFAHNKSYILYHTPKAVSPQCRVDIEKQFKALTEALSTTSAQAERIKAGLKPQWIPVSERLPEMDGTEYLIIRTGYNDVANNGIDMATAQRQLFWYGHTGIGDRLPMGFGVTHWMPLPELPRAAQLTSKTEEEGREG